MTIGKRHTKQNKKQKNGQYNTTNSVAILSGLLDDIEQFDGVIDHCAGEYDLIKAARYFGAKDYKAYDLYPVEDMEGYEAKKENTLLNVIKTPEGKWLDLENFPYLGSNKCKDAEQKKVFKKYGQTDLYKCGLAMLIEAEATDVISIHPANFWCETNPKARKLVFEYFDVVGVVKYFKDPVFADTKIQTTAVRLKRRECPRTDFSGLSVDFQFYVNGFEKEGDVIRLDLDERNLLIGQEEIKKWLEVSKSSELVLDKFNAGDSNENTTRLAISSITNGRHGFGAYLTNTKFAVRKSQIVNYCFKVEGLKEPLTPEQECAVVEMFNEKLNDARERHKDMFIGNYVDNQKIISQKIAKSLMVYCVESVIGNSN